MKDCQGITVSMRLLPATFSPAVSDGMSIEATNQVHRQLWRIPRLHIVNKNMIKEQILEEL